MMDRVLPIIPAAGLSGSEMSMDAEKFELIKPLGCPKKIRDLIFPYFCSKSENLCIKTHPDQILGNSEHKSSFTIEVEVYK